MHFIGIIPLYIHRPYFKKLITEDAIQIALCNGWQDDRDCRCLAYLRKQGVWNMAKENLWKCDEKVSVIVPIYKVESCLCNCLDSIIRQTYEHLEILLMTTFPRIAAERFEMNRAKRRENKSRSQKESRDVYNGNILT